MVPETVEDGREMRRFRIVGGKSTMGAGIGMVGDVRRCAGPHDAKIALRLWLSAAVPGQGRTRDPAILIIPPQTTAEDNAYPANLG